VIIAPSGPAPLRSRSTPKHRLGILRVQVAGSSSASRMAGWVDDGARDRHPLLLAAESAAACDSWLAGCQQLQHLSNWRSGTGPCPRCSGRWRCIGGAELGSSVVFLKTNPTIFCAARCVLRPRAGSDRARRMRHLAGGGGRQPARMGNSVDLPSPTAPHDSNSPASDRQVPAAQRVISTSPAR